MELEGSVALVSGAARGMGASHARGLVEKGSKVVIGDVLDDEGAQLAAELGDAARYLRLDVTVEDDWKAAVQMAESSFGPISLLVNNAGIHAFGGVDEMTVADFRRIIDVNLTGTYLGIHFTVPSIRRAGGGVIINVSSSAGMMGYAEIGAYVASKWGVRGLTKTAAMELGVDNIRVMSLHPGPIHTPMTADHGGDELALTQAIPRMGEPEEVTKMLLFMAADATYSTGSEWVVDGGTLLGHVPDPPQG